MAKSMKVMKATMKKAMKSSMKKAAMKSVMKKKAKKVSKIARGKMAKSMVFRGSKEKTSGGLKKSDLIRNKNGKLVSKLASQSSKKRYQGGKAAKWAAAVGKARSALKIKGFCAIGGKSTQGKALLNKARSLYK